MRILFFGDSMTYGKNDDEQCGWVNRLRLSYEQLPGDKHELYNLGISGNMAANVVKRLALETEARRWYDEQLVIVIAIGMNDTKYKGEEFASSTELYIGEMEQIVSAARQYTDKILIVGLNPVDEALTNPYKHSVAGSCYDNVRIKEFESALSEWCTEADLPFVPLLEPMNDKQQSQPLLADGLHPNALGHQFIADTVRPELDKLLKV
jgi:lysophospholipase L1-like esterase